MAHITSPRLRIAERIARKLAPKVRRQVGDMARQQVKGISLLQQAVDFANKMGGDIAYNLAESYPQDTLIINGETVQHGEDGRAVWHIAALGGLENMSRGDDHFYHMFSITVDGAPSEALAYDPITDEVAIVVKGSGAYGFGTRLRMANPKKAEGGRIHVWGKTVPEYLNGAELRITGSAAADVLAVCAGKADGLVATDFPQTEALFAWLMATESGGRASMPSPKNNTFVVANNAFYKELIK